MCHPGPRGRLYTAGPDRSRRDSAPEVGSSCALACADCCFTAFTRRRRPATQPPHHHSICSRPQASGLNPDSARFVLAPILCASALVAQPVGPNEGTVFLIASAVCYALLMKTAIGLGPGILLALSACAAAALGSLKLLLIDFRQSTPATLAISLICYGGLLLLLAKMRFNTETKSR